MGKNLNSLIAGMAVGGIVTWGLTEAINSEPGNKSPQKISTIDGKVVNEVRSSLGSALNYAFTIETQEGKEYTFGVYNLQATQADSLINMGDTIKIDLRGIDETKVFGPMLTHLKYVSKIKK